MCHTKYKPNIPVVLEKKFDLIGFAIFSYNHHLGLSTKQNFITLKHRSLVMLYEKF